MEQRELIIFIVIANLILLVFITGIILFIFQFRRRKIAHETEKEQINQAHKEELLNNQIDAQSKTMKVIGQEIHDNVGQKLTLASIFSNQLSNDNPTQNQKIEQISKLLYESLNDLRQLSKSLVNPHLAQSDLIELLQNEATQINQSGFTKLKIKTDLRSINLDFEQKNSLFRVLQEFIQNSLKHANSKQILIKIEKSQIIIEDDGNGFDLNKKSNGIGLTNMKRRATEIGVGFELNSVIGKGTKMSLKLPQI